MLNSFESVKKTVENNGVNQIVNKDSKTTPVEEVKKINKLGCAECFKGNFDVAINFYTQGLSICPESEKGKLSVLFYNRAVAYSNLKKNENCVADCNSALALNPTYKKALSRRARAHAALENFKLASVDISVVIILDQLTNQTDIDFSASVMDSLGKLNLEQYKKNGPFILPSKTIIETYMISFCYDPFNDEFSQTLMKSNVNTGLELALKCIKNKNYDDIEVACKDELNKTDNSLIRRSLALNLLATFSILRGDFTIGIGHLTTVIDTSGVPNKLIINSLIKRASAYHQQEQVEKLNEDLECAENIDPNSSEVFYHRANIYLIEEDLEKAIEGFKRAVELNPKFVLSYVKYYYAQYLLAKRTSNEFGIKKYLGKLKEFVNRFPNNSESYLLYSMALTSNGAYKKAYSLLKKGHKIHPDNANFLVQSALVRFDWKNSISDAVNILKQALKIDSKCIYAYKTLGELYMLKGKLKKAVESFEKVIPLTKSYEELLRMFIIINNCKANLAALEWLKLISQF